MVHLVLGMLRIVLGARGARATLASVPSFLAAATPWIFPATGRGPRRRSPRTSSGTSRPAASCAWPGDPRRPRRARRPTTTLRVLGVRRETDEIRTFRLERPPGFDFLPGQYLTVVVPVEGKLVSRCYSICSAPDEPRHLEISVRRQGLVSAALHESVRSGGAIAARKPAGKFVYPSDSRRPIVLLGGGVGITPLLAMLRHAAAADPGREVTLLLSVRTGAQIPFRAELEELGRRPGLRVVVTATRGGAVPPVRVGAAGPRLRQARGRAIRPLASSACAARRDDRRLQEGPSRARRAARPGAGRGLRGGQARPGGARARAAPSRSS